MTTIPYGRQDITDEDVAAVERVLRSDWVTQGPEVPRFETAVAEYCGARHAVAMNSATSALHIACLALGVGSGDSLWTTPNTFVASANCGVYCGARVDFVDIDPRTLNLSTAALATKLEHARIRGTLPKVLVAVHFGGQSCDMRAISTLSREYGFHVIEDASHAIGGRYAGRPVGCCEFSDVTVFSFHPVKLITTAEGGMAVTNRREIAERMCMLRTHGITRDPKAMSQGAVPHGPWYYEQVELGFNYRMTDILAALGASQLHRLDAYVARRHEIARAYSEAFRDLPLHAQYPAPDAYSALHLFVVRLRAPAPSRSEVFASLRAAGIGVNVHYIPVHLHPFYVRMGFRAGMFPEAERYYAEALTLPMFPTLTDAQQAHVIESLRRAVSAAQVG